MASSTTKKPKPVAVRELNGVARSRVVSGLLTQVLVAEKYGLRLDIVQLAAVLDLKPSTLRNQISAGTCKVPTYVDGGKRWADHRDVAAYFDWLRESAR